MDPWRLLSTGAKDAFTNMAIDESLLREQKSKGSGTVRFYRWKPSAISIGYFQAIEREVDLEVCKSKKVDVVRRITGGGAVYHDYKGEITYSIVVSEKHKLIPQDIQSSYHVLCAGLVEGLRLLGIPAEFKPINDIVVNGKKISGNAHTRRYCSVLQHGTILCDVDTSLMFRLLRVPSEKLRHKLIENIEERVTSIKKELGVVHQEKIIQMLVNGFERSLGVKVVEGELSDEELALVKELRTKYASKEWNFKR